MPKTEIDFAVVQEIARALPGVEQSTIHGNPSLKVHGKLLTCPAIHRSAEAGTLAVQIEPAERAKLIESKPDIYYVTDHYHNYPTVLVRLSQINRRALTDLLSRAWEFVNAHAKKSRRASRPV